jgi:hypothetical protein
MPAVARTIALDARFEAASVPAPADDPPAAAAAAPASVASSRRDPVVLLAAALVLVPALVAAVSALRHPWIPTNDWALIELQVRKVGTRDTPLTGVYSRYAWRHPGPLFLYALALPYRLVPADRGLLFATACVNLAATAGFVLVVIRYRRSQALVALFGLAILLRGFGIDQLSDPWNPTILIVPFALYTVLCLDIALGQARWPLPVAVGVGSFVVQSHVGLLQPVVLLGVVAVGLRWVQHRPRLAWRPLLPTAGVLFAAWLAPLIDQVNGTGNLGRLARWSLGDDSGGGMLTEGRLGGGQILDGSAWLLDPTGVWVGRFQPKQVYGVSLLAAGRPLVLLWIPVVLGLAFALARWAPMEAPARRATVLAGVIAATGIVAVFTDLFTVRGGPVFHQFRWVVVAMMLVWISLGWAVAGVVTARFPWIDSGWPPAGGAGRARALALGGLMVAAVAVPVGLAAWRGPVGRQPVQPASEALLRLVPAIEKYTRQEPLIAANSTLKINDKDLGLPVVLERAGIDWIEYDDPRASRYRSFLVGSLSMAESPLLTKAFADGSVVMLARSGPPPPGQPPESELVLLRFEPHPVASASPFD